MTRKPSNPRLPEFHGPDQLQAAVRAAADPHHDGAVVRHLIQSDVARSIVAIHDAKKDGDTSSADMFEALVPHVPALRTIDALALELWGNISVGSLALRDPLGGVFVADDGGIEPHIDIRPADITEKSDSRFCGPIGMSLGLFASARFGVTKPPLDMFLDTDGDLSVAALQHYRQSVYDDVPELRSTTVQGVGDLVIWIPPFTVHGVETDKPAERVALIMEQSQAPIS